MKLQVLMLFKKYYMNLDINQIKYGKIKAVNFTNNQLNLGYKVIM